MVYASGVGAEGWGRGKTCRRARKCVRHGLWFMVYDLWFIVYGLWFMVEDVGFGVGGLMFEVEGMRLRAERVWFMV